MKPLYLTQAEATLAAQHKLTAIVRVMKKQPVYVQAEMHEGKSTACYQYPPYNPQHRPMAEIEKDARCIPFQPDSIVPAKETWAYSGIIKKIRYKVDNDDEYISWRSPITMPLSAVRHFYKIKSVRGMQGKELKDFGIWLIQDEHYKWCHDNTWLWYAEIEESEKEK